MFYTLSNFTCAMLAHVLSFSIKLFGNISPTAKHNIQVLHVYKYPVGPTLCCYSDKLSATAERPHDMPGRRMFSLIGAHCAKI